MNVKDALLKPILQWIYVACSLLLFWILIIKVFQPQAWLLPSPGAVWVRFVELLHHGDLLSHLNVTIFEILIGYMIGVGSGFLVGYPVSQIRALERIMTPYLVAGNSIPLVAFAPLLLLWFGNGVLTKVIVTAMIVFLPMTISTVTGFRTQKPILRRLMRTLRCNKWKTFLHLELPAAMPSLCSGMKIGAPLAVVGAVVGEFLGSGKGLGHLILEANGLLDTAQLFVSNIILGCIGILFYTSIQTFEILLLGHWQQRRKER